jgi:hypothetical protein
MCFYLTSLGSNRFILGYPFLFVFNPNVDWRAATLKGGAVNVETVHFRRVQKRVKICQTEVQRWESQLQDDEAVWMRKIMMAHQWAHEAHQGSEPKQQELPEEYHCHAWVFDKD